MMDLLSERHPFYDPIAKIASLADKGQLEMIVSALSYTTVNYLLTKMVQRPLKINLGSFELFQKLQVWTTR